MTRLRLLTLALLTFALPLCAQDEVKEGKGDQDGGGGREIKAGTPGKDGGVILVEKGGKLVKEIEGKDVEAKGVGQVMNAGARGLCRFDTALKPKRLLPGQSGTALVTMIFEGDAVMMAPAPLQVRPVDGNVPTGQWSIRPAPRASVAKFFANQQVYDNYAVVEVPVTMPSTAALGGKQYVPLEFNFDLVSGTTGAPLGHFVERVSVVCDIGLVADPSVAALPAANVNPAPTAPTPAPTTAGTQSAPPEQRSPATDDGAVVTGNVQEMPAGKDPAEGHSLGGGAGNDGLHPPPIDDSGMSSLWLVGGGGVLVLVLIIALMRRGS